MSNPTPESLALVDFFSARSRMEWDVLREEYAKRIDAYVAERTELLNAQHAAACGYIAHLRAAADAMADAFAVWMAPVDRYDATAAEVAWQNLIDSVAGYSALSPTDERP